MKILGLFVLVSALSTGASAFANTNASTCTQLLALAAKNVANVNDRFNVGEVTRVDVNTALLSQLEVRFECRDILAKDYCDTALPLAQANLEGIKEEQRAGQREASESFAAEKNVIELQGLCR